MIVEITLGIIIWTILSITWFLQGMGNKFGEDKWYDYLLSPPVMIIAYMIGAITLVINLVKRKD